MGTHTEASVISHEQPDTLIPGYRGVQRVIPLDRVTIWKKVKEGDFPKPIMLTPTRPAWWRSELLAWAESRRRA